MSTLYHIVPAFKSIPVEIVQHINSLESKGKPYAAFDLDDTLLNGDIGEAVFALLVKKRLIKNFGWEDYLALLEQNRLKAYKRIIDLMLGLKIGMLEKITHEIIKNKHTAITLEGCKIGIPKPDKIMKEILHLIKEKGIAVYVVTASNEVSARIICKKYFDIPASQIIGARVAYDKKGFIKLSDLELTYGKGKINALKKRFRNKPLITGGDSPGDKYLLAYTDRNGIRFWLGEI